MIPILGHHAVIRQLWSALDRRALHHAILLEGPRGVGKRLVADRLAMAANCMADEARPCGACPTCRQIASGVHPDVIVIEPNTTRAARTIPVEAIREVVRQTQYHRYGARRRFVIVDPAEAMQEPAANALLKTLEEPPDGTGFLVVTHNASALLPTILSRCQRIRMGAVPAAEIRDWLEGQGRERAEAAARLSLGCPGRALELARDGLAERDARREELLGVLRAPLGDVFPWSARITSGARQDWAERVDGLLEIVEDLLRDAAVFGADSRAPLLDPDATDEARRWAEALWPDGIERCARAVQDARSDLASFVSGKTVLDALLTVLRRELGRA